MMLIKLKPIVFIGVALICQAGFDAAVCAEEARVYTNDSYGLEVRLPANAVLCTYEEPKGNHQVDLILRENAECGRARTEDIEMEVFAVFSDAEAQNLPPIRREIARIYCEKFSRGAEAIRFVDRPRRIAGLPAFECRRTFRGKDGTAYLALNYFFFRGQAETDDPQRNPYPRIMYHLAVFALMTLEAEAVAALDELTVGTRLVRPLL